jgi:hypothetical protein
MALPEYDELVQPEKQSALPSYEDLTATKPTTDLVAFAGESGPTPELIESSSGTPSGKALENFSQATAEFGRDFLMSALKKPTLSELLIPGGLPEDRIKQAAQLLTGKRPEEVIPEVQSIVESGKTPAFSKERFRTGLDITGEMLTLAGIARGAELAARPKLTERLGLSEPPTAAAPEPPVLTEQAAKERTQVSDTQSQRGIQGGQLEGQEPGRTVQEQGGGGETAPAGGVLQTPQVTPSVEQAAAVSGPESPPAAAPTQERIVATVVQTPEGKMLLGQSKFEPHDAIGIRNDIDQVPEEQRGFVAEDPQGVQRFVGRDEGGKIADSSGQRGQELAGSPLHSEQLQEAAEKPAAPVPIESTSTEPHVSGIANRISREKAARGEVGEIAPGQGQSVMELRERGLKMSPEEINQHVSDVMAGTGDIVKQGEALTAEEARLSQRSNQLSREAESDPKNVEKKLAADNAFKDLTDFHNGPIATLKTRWSDAGRTLQGEIPVDLSTFNGMREAWLKDTGNPPPPEAEPILRKMANKVSGANGEADAAIGKIGDAIEKSARGRKIPSYDQIRENILQRLRERTPCN